MGERQEKMKCTYYFEGHKAKSSLEDENTLLVGRSEACATLEEATQKARGHFDKEKELSLAIIYKEESQGHREGVLFIYKDEEGKLEESSLYWGTCDVCTGY
jgi:hypothetical protein